ncbi:hypothetical protein ACRAWD_22075 [Caulobacter segnis]
MYTVHGSSDLEGDPTRAEHGTFAYDDTTGPTKASAATQAWGSITMGLLISWKFGSEMSCDPAQDMRALGHKRIGTDGDAVHAVAVDVWSQEREFAHLQIGRHQTRTLG